MTGQPFLAASLGADARLAVEVAWGADPAGDSALWTWTDITGKVRQEPSGISFQYGRADETSETQPASGSMTLDNTDHSFSLGGISPNWPNVRQNVPLRVRIDPDGNGFRVAFQGNIVDYAPEWDVTGNIATMAIRLAGTLQRLSQSNGKAPRSAPLRYLTMQASPPPLVYYPLDEGPLADKGRAVIGTGEAVIDLKHLTAPTTSPVQVWGQGNLAPWLPNGVKISDNIVLRMGFPGRTGEALTSWTLDFLVNFSGTSTEEDIPAAVDVSAALSDNVGTQLHHTILFYQFERKVSILSVNNGTEFASPAADLSDRLFDGDVHHIRFHVRQSGADTRTELYLDGTALISTTNGIAIQLTRPPDFTFWNSSVSPVYYGHAALWVNTFPPVGNDEAAESAYHYLGMVGDSALERLERIGGVDGVPIEILGDTGDQEDTAGDMGPQPTEEIMPLLRESERADQGILFDGLGSGLTYVARDMIENAEPALTIDVGNEELYPTFSPVHNDERLLNRMTARRTLGGEYVYEDTDGPRGTATVGLQENSQDFNVSAESRIEDYASWAVHLGTSEGYRYPTVTLNLTKVPHLATTVLSLRPGARIDLINVGQALRGHSEDNVSLIVEGISMSFPSGQWLATFQCSLFDLWRITVLAEDTGDTDEFLCHLDTDGSHLSATAAVGATSLTVVTDSGPVWTQDADDFPFDISVAGIKVTVTNVTGAASPQTFTVEPLALARANNSPVEIWQPTALRL
jgi:hypothetical protein